MNTIRASLLVLAGLALAGCGADGEPEQPTRNAGAATSGHGIPG
ncbi:argininosuccinate lyase [Ruegeria sediminis]|uniref:Argininosuccinate lyase n=1 Tax=Ruegeria sediminis TaxID=2583820 RepID=A0ABY2X4B3_9RHOB|nr:argininosuccinate lyase [Ruegeria sediminis]TMV10234.1 argininosuccinate lyase [Ruegeria sediminis]